MSQKLVKIHNTQIVQQLLQEAQNYEKQLAADLRRQILNVRKNDPTSTLPPVGNTQTLRSLLERYVFNEIEPEPLLDNDRFVRFNTRSLRLNNKISLIYDSEDDDTKREVQTYTLTPKQRDEFLNLRRKKASDTQLVGIIYEPIIVNKLTERVVKKLQDPNIPIKLDDFDIEAGKQVGGTDIIMYIPSTIQAPPNSLQAYRDQMNIDIKSNSWAFGIGSPGQAARQYITQIGEDLKDQRLHASGQQALLIKESLEDIIALNILQWKIREKYPVFLGATDGQFLLSSEILKKGLGDFWVDFDISPAAKDKIYQTSLAEAEALKNKRRLDKAIAHNIATSATIKHLQKTELWFYRKRSIGGK